MTARETIGAFLDEARALDDLVAELVENDWATTTPAPGWTIAHQVAHLAWADEAAAASIGDAAAFDLILAAAAADPLGYADTMARRGIDCSSAELLERWRTSRSALGRALSALPADARIRWFGPPMGVRAMATARLMEVWAHGQDVADALGVRREATERLRDIAHLGVRTRDFAYRLHGHPVPDHEFSIALRGPSGAQWHWGPDGAEDSVSGSAEDFCLVVTQRRSVGDTDLQATGEAARWLRFAQIFAGPPTARP